MVHDEQGLFHAFFTDGDTELHLVLDDMLALFYQLWATRFTKDLKLYPEKKNDIVSNVTKFLLGERATIEESQWVEAKKRFMELQEIINKHT